MVVGAEPSVRDAVLSELELLASLELQAKYERDVPVADVPAELVCGWFDDLDMPASASSVFAGKDLESVRAFSDSFEKVLKDLQGLSLAELHANPRWLEIVENARSLLQQLRVAG
jgi:hypothetical protein